MTEHTMQAPDEVDPAGTVVVPQARPSARLKLAITAFVLLFGLGGYAWLGNFQGLSVAPGETGVAQGGGNGDATDAAQFAAIVDQLAERLKTNPDDAEGWSMLGRSYAVMGRHAEATRAFKRLMELRPQDAQAHADYADALAMANGQSLEGEPSRYIGLALKLDPNNLKALALAGTIAYQKSDFKGAIDLWQRAVRIGDPNSELVAGLKGGIEDARQRMGGSSPGPAEPAAPAAVAATPAARPDTVPPATAAPAANGAPPAAAAAEAVTGRVTLAPALKTKVAPDDTVFVFVRAAEGARMPLAILRKQVKELPIEFTLDDSMAMSPAARLSGAPMVVVGARISRSGNAMPQPGDMQGLSAPVKPGAKGLAIEISETLP